MTEVNEGVDGGVDHVDVGVVVVDAKGEGAAGV